MTQGQHTPDDKQKTLHCSLSPPPDLTPSPQLQLPVDASSDVNHDLHVSGIEFVSLYYI